MFISKIFYYLYMGAVTRQRGDGGKVSPFRGTFMYSLANGCYVLGILNLTMGKALFEWDDRNPGLPGIHFILLFFLIIISAFLLFYAFPNVSVDHRENRTRSWVKWAYTVFLLYFFIGIGFALYTFYQTEDLMNKGLL